jgi:predicted RNase H-like HicB family nuclease
MQLIIEVEQEEDGRWISEIPELPGVLAYGETRSEAVVRAQVLALRVMADRIEHGEALPVKANVLPQVFSVAA